MPPGEVDQLTSRLGARLKLCRVRRGLTSEAVAAKIGVGIRAVREAERGNPATAIRVSVALLSLYGLTADLERVADPAHDTEGLQLGGPDEHRQRARRQVKKPVPAPPPSKAPVQLAAPAGLAPAILRSLSAAERAALALLQQHGSARTRELATALGYRPNRVGGLMRELRRKLHGLGLRNLLTDENLPDGESLFRVNGSRT